MARRIKEHRLRAGLESLGSELVAWGVEHIACGIGYGLKKLSILQFFAVNTVRAFSLNSAMLVIW